MKQFLVFQTKLGELKAIPVTDPNKARKILATKQTMKWQGDSVVVKGVMSEEDYEAFKLFYKHQPSHYELWKKNMEYLKKYKHWPKT